MDNEKILKNKKLLDKKIEDREKILKEKLLKNKDEDNINPEENLEFIKNKINFLKKEFIEKTEIIKNENQISIEDEDFLRNKLNFLKEYINECNYCLTSFYQKTFKDEYILIENLFNDTLLKYKKKKKFGFNKKNITKFNKKEEEVIEQNLNQNNNSLNIKGIVDLKDQNIIVNQNDLEEIYKIENIENCKININGITKVIYIKNIKNSVLKIGPTMNSVFIDNINNSDIHIVGHQIRIHNSYDTNFFVFTTSKLIIEKCKRLIFNEFLHSYDNFNSDFEKCNFNNKVNLWKEVQDFDWIKEEKSPNFNINN